MNKGEVFSSRIVLTAIVQLLSTVRMQYLIGVILAAVAVGAAVLIGFDHDRAFYPTLLIGVASYYVLFAVMGASTQILGLEIAIAIGFLVFAVCGFKRNLWLVAAAFVAHGAFDLVHRFLIQSPGVPRWWPGFCLTFDVIIGGQLIVSLMKGSGSSTGPSTRQTMRGRQAIHYYGEGCNRATIAGEHTREQRRLGAC